MLDNHYFLYWAPASGTVFDMEVPSRLRNQSAVTLNDPEPTAPQRRRPILIPVGIIGVLALALGAFLSASGGSGVVTPADSSSVPITLAPLDPATAEEASLALVDQMFAAFERGDLAAMKSNFADDIDITGHLGGDFDAVMEWSIAQQLQIGGRECVATRAVDATETRVQCEYRATDYLMRTLGAEPAIYVATLDVSDAREIVFYNERQPSNAVLLIGQYFASWLTDEHPSDAAGALCCQWESTAQAIAGGEVWVEFAGEYAAYLEASGCTYNARCRP